MATAFASTVDARRCASEIQAAMLDQEVGVPSADRIQLRIGIHRRHRLREDEDIFGDGVNIAARLEALAEPGGICDLERLIDKEAVSARVQEDAVGKLNLAFRDLGEQLLKSVGRRIGTKLSSGGLVRRSRAGKPRHFRRGAVRRSPVRVVMRFTPVSRSRGAP